jgi:predicted Zn-dependent protease
MDREMDKKENLEHLNDLISYIKGKLEKFCTEWAISGIYSNQNHIRFSEKKIDINKNWDEIRFNLFLSKKRRTSEITISDLRKPSIENTLEYCEKLLDSSKRNTNFKKLPKGPFKYDKSIQPMIYDENVVELHEDATDLVEKSIEKCLQQGVARAAGSFFYGSILNILETSEGIAASFKKTNLNFRIRAFAEDMYATGEALSVSTHLNQEFDPISAGEEAGQICKQAIGGKKGEPGTYNIIIYPKVSTEIQAPTAALAMNKYIMKMGLSWLVGKKRGDEFGNDKITIWDDGTKEYGLATSPFDDEGVPRTRTVLIKDGVIQNFFTNTSLSERGENSTANAGITIPKPTNTVFKPGDHTLEELMEISESPTLLITSTWYTRYQSYAPPGVFSSLPKDGMFLVEDRGKQLTPVRELRINSNQYEILKNTIALGKNNKQVATWLSTSNNTVFAPFMLIEDIKMTTGTK